MSDVSETIRQREKINELKRLVASQSEIIARYEEIVDILCLVMRQQQNQKQA